MNDQQVEKRCLQASGGPAFLDSSSAHIEYFKVISTALFVVVFSYKNQWKSVMYDDNIYKNNFNAFLMHFIVTF